MKVKWKENEIININYIYINIALILHLGISATLPNIIAINLTKI